MKIRNFTIIIALLGISSGLYAETNFVTAQLSYREVTITGFTRARSTMRLASEVSGKVKQVFADVGETIPRKVNFPVLMTHL